MIFTFLNFFGIKVSRHPDKCTYYLFFIPILKLKYKYPYIFVFLFGFVPSYKYNHDRIINNRYKKIIKKLKCKSKINIAFLVRENSKWSYDYLYKKLNSDNVFNSMILIVEETGHEKQLCDIKKNIQFFNKYNYYIVKKFSDIKYLNIDILFYEQPWFDLTGDFTPEKMSKYALTMYSPYGLEVDLHESLFVATGNFLRNLFITFAFSNDIKLLYEKHNIKNLCVVGHPRLDVYMEENKLIPWHTKKVRIIYAPHHSFNNSTLKWGSFEWSGNHILELARKNQDDTEWIFKPHPRFKLELENLLGSNHAAQSVFDDWAKVSTLLDTGDYFDSFKTADLMISDCGSFKIEWLPTRKPFIQLLSHYSDMQPYGKNMDYYSSAYYKADNVNDIDKLFNMLVKERVDPLRKKRDKLADEIILGTSDKIYKFIKGLLK